MKEIGGYFGLEQFAGRAYHEGLVAVNSGRNALLYILKARQVQKLYIPSFLCDSVSELCKREGYAYEEYPINADFLPEFSKKLGTGEYLYVVNYYGQIQNEQILALKAKHGRIVMDNVQAFFQKPVPGVDTVYSCRKYFGVPDGGYAATDCEPAEALPKDVSKDRMKHILGRFEENATTYYGDFQENDERFYELPLREMSALTENILRAVDYAAVKERRNENYKALAQLLDSRNKLRLTMPEGPYCYPFYCENGMELKRKLAACKIFIPTLWPNVRNMEGALEKDYAENILPLPCDQRYGPEDMLRMANELLAHIDR